MFLSIFRYVSKCPNKSSELRFLASCYDYSDCAMSTCQAWYLEGVGKIGRWVLGKNFNGVTLGFYNGGKSLVVRFKWCEMARLLTNPTIYLYELLYFMSSFLRTQSFKRCRFGSSKMSSKKRFWRKSKLLISRVSFLVPEFFNTRNSDQIWNFR